MSILIKSGDEYYEIPDEIFKRCRVAKNQFEKDLKNVSSEMATEISAGKSDTPFNVVDLSDYPD